MFSDSLNYYGCYLINTAYHCAFTRRKVYIMTALCFAVSLVYENTQVDLD